jgi:hypothetical protein
MVCFVSGSYHVEIGWPIHKTNLSVDPRKLFFATSRDKGEAVRTSVSSVRDPFESVSEPGEFPWQPEEELII